MQNSEIVSPPGRPNADDEDDIDPFDKMDKESEESDSYEEGDYNFGSLYIYCLLRGFGSDPDTIVKYKVC